MIILLLSFIHCPFLLCDKIYEPEINPVAIKQNCLFIIVTAQKAKSKSNKKNLICHKMNCIIGTTVGYILKLIL